MEYPSWTEFKSTLLYLRYDHHDGANLFIDLGWAPESDPKGRFVLILLRGDDIESWRNPLDVFESCSKKKIVDKLNEWMLAVSHKEIR